MAFFNKPEKSPPSPRVRRIVNDVIYDNAKAECVASHMKRRSSGAWKYFSQEILYRSSQGNWFFVLGQRLHVDRNVGKLPVPARLALEARMLLGPAADRLLVGHRGVVADHREVVAVA